MNIPGAGFASCCHTVLRFTIRLGNFTLQFPHGFLKQIVIHISKNYTYLSISSSCLWGNGVEYWKAVVGVDDAEIERGGGDVKMVEIGG